MANGVFPMKPKLARNDAILQSIPTAKERLIQPIPYAMQQLNMDTVELPSNSG